MTDVAWSDWWGSLSEPAKDKYQRTQSSVETMPPPGWFLAVFDSPDSEPRLERFDSIEQLTRRLVCLGDTMAVPMHGWCLKYARRRGSHMRYLRHPDGRLIPIYDESTPIEDTNSFYLGEPIPEVIVDPAVLARLRRYGQQQDDAEEDVFKFVDDEALEDDDGSPAFPYGRLNGEE